MKQKSINYLASLLLAVVGFMGFQSCDKNDKPQPPVVGETLSITPKEASIKMGEILTIKVLSGTKEVTTQATFTTAPEGIIPRRVKSPLSRQERAFLRQLTTESKPKQPSP